MHPFHAHVPAVTAAIVALAAIAPAHASDGGAAGWQDPSGLAVAGATPNGTVLFHDDFADCTTAPSASRWKPERRQWGGLDINAGVVPENVGWYGPRSGAMGRRRSPISPLPPAHDRLQRP